MFEALGSRTYRWRYLIVVAWVLAMIASVKLAPSLAGQAASDQAAFLPSNVPSMLANDALDKAFPGATAASTATLTFSRDTGLTDADIAYLDATAAWARSAAAPAELRDAVTGTASAASRPELSSMLKSADGKLQLLLVDLNVSSAGDAAAAVVSDLRDHVAQAPDGLVVHVTGTAGITSDYLQAVKSGTDSTTAVTVVLVLVILLLIYRAPLAAMVPLITIAGAYVVSRGVLGLLAAAGWKVTSLLDTFLVVLVFGVGTDYAIFLISRFREEVSGGVDWHDASRDTVRRIGAVISASAATVIVGLGAMAFGQFEMIKSTGPALAVAIAVTLLSGLTLTPALLGIFGHYLFWPLHTRPTPDGEPGGFFAKLAAAVSRHPGVVTLALIVALGLPAMFVQQMHTNFDTLAELPANSDARQGFDVVAAHLGKGKLVQSTGLIDTQSGDMLAPAELARLRDTVLALQADPGVAQVTSLVTPDGDGKVPDGFRPSIQLKTIGDAFSSDSSSSSSSAAASGSSSSLLDPKLTDGLDQALNYVGALGAAYPDVAGRAEYRTARQSITAAQDLVARVKKQTVVATQLRTLAAALTSPTAVASGSGGSSSSGSDASLMAKYLDELATKYPEVRPLTAYRDAVRSAASLAVKPSATAAVDTADAMNALAVHFDSQPESRLSPTSLANTSSALELKREAKATFAAIPGAFTGLADVFAARSDDLFVPVGLGGDNAKKLTDAVDAFVSQNHTATRFYLVSANDPYASESFATIRAAQAQLTAAAPGFGPSAQAYLGGPTAQFSDVQTTLESDFNRVGVITVIGIFLVLVLLLRALVAPLYLVGTVLLSYLSAVGLSAFLFQDVLHHAGISFYLPLMVFVLLVALGSDYNIFLMSRVREESEHRSIRDGIRIASGHTGSVITSAGLILAGTFGSMASAPLIVLFQVGVAVAIGVLIDTFIVRSVLVPAITTLVGDRAWWPSGSRFTPAPIGEAPGLAGGVAASGGALLAAEASGLPAAAGLEPAPSLAADLDAAPALERDVARRPRRSLLRAALALGLAVLVPVTFAGLVTWAWQPKADAVTLQAAVVNADTGTSYTAGDGSTKPLELGKELSDGLVASSATPSDPSSASSSGIAWSATDAQAAADGLASGRYAAVLVIPTDFSRAIAAIQAGTSGDTPSATLHLDTGSGGGNVASAVAQSVREAISASATRHATASYVEDVLLGVSAAQGGIAAAGSSAKGVADSATSLADAASSVNAVSGEMVSGLDKLAAGTSQSVSGTSALVNGTGQLATGTKQLASAGSSLADGAKKTASGASALASGISAIATGLAQLDAQTKALPGQTSQLASGASDLAAGVSQTAAGAAALADGLHTLAVNTTGLGSQVQALNAGAASLAAGAGDLATGAGQAAGAAAGVKTGADGLQTGVDSYTAGVDQLAANCTALGGGPGVCSALSGIASGSTALRGSAAALATGAGLASDAAAGVNSGAALNASGATTLHDGLSQLAAGAPSIESGIASSAAGAASLSGGAGQLKTGADQLAAGTKQLSDGMPALAGGVSGLATGASQSATGASQLSTGANALASGMQQLATGLAKTATGASQLASGTKSAASGAGKLSDAVNQALDGARVVQAETGQLATDSKSVSSDASKVSDSLATTAGALPAAGTADRSAVAARIANPVSVEATAASDSAGITPLAMVLALWLGALAALLAVPSLGRGRRWWSGPLGAVALAAVAGLVAAGLMVAGLAFGVGIDVARLPLLVGVTLLAAAAFAVVVGALATAFGLRGWVAALLLAGLGVAASGYPFGVDALPGPLAFVRPILPSSWAIDGIRAAIESATASVALDVAVLAVWLVVAGLVVLALTIGVARRTVAEPGAA